MYLKTHIQTECMGCGVCQDICPKLCISFKADGEGFKYPNIDESKCIHCNLCEMVCPNQFDMFLEAYPQVKVGVHRSDEVVYSSASGGAFTALYTELIKNGYRVYGVKYSGHLQVIHDHADTMADCEEFRKSKYVLSDSNHCYKKIADDLLANRKVLFTGLPCQCAALCSYLYQRKVNRSQLVIIDLVCHGGPNQEIFDSYIAEMEKEAKERICRFSFRSKEKINGQVNSRSAEIVFVSGDRTIRNVKNDAFLKGYYNRLFYRPSCGECIFARPERVSDITLGDAWGIEKIQEGYDPLKGVSLIIANTTVGMNLLSKLELDMELIDVPFQWALQANAQLNRPTSMHRKRAKFFKLWKKRGFKYAVEKATHRSISAKIIGKAIKLVNAK